MWLPSVSDQKTCVLKVPFLSVSRKNYHLFAYILRIPILLVSWWVTLAWGWPLCPSEQARKDLNRLTGSTGCFLRCSTHMTICLGEQLDPQEVSWKQCHQKGNSHGHWLQMEKLKTKGSSGWARILRRVLTLHPLRYQDPKETLSDFLRRSVIRWGWVSFRAL